jgi:hypothetical protein
LRVTPRKLPDFLPRIAKFSGTIAVEELAGLFLAVVVDHGHDGTDFVVLNQFAVDLNGH